MAEETYSTDGPLCPFCGHQETPDEPFYFDESATSFECSSCGESYGVRIYIQTSWTTFADA